MIAFRTLDDLEKATHRLVNENRFEDAFTLIVKFVESVIHDQTSVGEILSSERLDKLCQDAKHSYVARRPKKNRKPPDDKAPVSVILTTEISQYGGHSRVIEDLLRSRPTYRHLILATDFFDRMPPISSQDAYQNAEVVIVPKGTYCSKIDWLLDFWESISLSEIFLFNFNQDIVSIIGLPASDSAKIIFYHHADHHLCLGVHLKNSIHVDPHNFGYFNCRTFEGVRDNHYLPLTAYSGPDLGRRATFMLDGSLKTCTSGRTEKFQLPYPYQYEDLIVERLRTMPGEHLHIGGLSETLVEGIKNKIQSAGLDYGRFRQLTYVPNLMIALIENNIDLYIASVPFGGARAAVEAMAAGVPLLMHKSMLTRFHGGVDLAYPEANVWTNFNEFVEVLKTLNAENLAEHSRWALSHFKQNHSEQYMRASLEALLSNKQEAPPPKLRPFSADKLDKFNIHREIRVPLDFLLKIKILETELSNVADRANTAELELTQIRSSKSWRLVETIRAFLRRLRLEPRAIELPK